MNCVRCHCWSWLRTKGKYVLNKGLDIITSAERGNVSEVEYMVPTAFHHGLVMLLHVAGHLINTGIGLRHLCDWAVFAAKFSDEEFCEMFEDN